MSGLCYSLPVTVSAKPHKTRRTLAIPAKMDPEGIAKPFHQARAQLPCMLAGRLADGFASLLRSIWGNEFRIVKPHEAGEGHINIRIRWFLPCLSRVPPVRMFLILLGFASWALNLRTTWSRSKLGSLILGQVKSIDPPRLTNS